MKIEKFSLGILGANCYLLINEETKDTVVVDPGGHSKKFTAYIEEEKLNPCGNSSDSWTFRSYYGN